jgi:hypothetical protein
MDNNVQILPSNKIDPIKWNHCIEHSSNTLIYADYFFLTSQCDNWSGVIINNYKTVMPLPWRKKWGVRYLYAPAFIQQLGLFGDLSNLSIYQLLNTIRGFVRYGDLYFNYQNFVVINKLEFFLKTNYILELSQSYHQIYSNYSHDLIKNLQKSEKHKLKYSNEIKIEAAILQFQHQYHDRFPQYDFKVYQKLTATCLELAKKNQCTIRSVYSESGKDPLSIALLLKDKKRLYLLLNITNSNGRSSAANHYLIDRIIQEFCEEELVFDFEGSERKGIKEFYESFQPKLQQYFHYRFNHLPFWINWARQIFKKT